MNKHKILKDDQTQIMNKHKILKDDQISFETQITKNPKL